MQAASDTAIPAGGGRGWGWRRTLLTGLLLWISSVVVTALTENVLVIPTVVLLGSLMSMEIARGFLAPFGHGLWTAITGGALFAASRQGRLRVSWSVVGSYLGVALLNASWDSMWIVAIVLSALYLKLPTVGDPWIGTRVPPAAEQALVFFGCVFGGLSALSLVGMAMIQRQWCAEERERDAAVTDRGATVPGGSRPVVRRGSPRSPGMRKGDWHERAV